MKTYQTLPLLLATLILLSPSATGQEKPVPAQEKTARSQIFFENDETEVPAIAWYRLVDFFREVTSKNAIDSIAVNGYASPAGTHPYNEQLSWSRARTVTKMVTEALDGLSIPRGFPITTSGNAEDWNTLAELLPRLGLAEADTLACIIKTTPLFITDGDGRVVDGRQHRMMEYKGGETYIWLRDEFFWRLRRADVLVFMHPLEKPSPLRDEPKEEPAMERQTPEEIIPEKDYPVIENTSTNHEEATRTPLRRYVLNLRTNALVPLFNIGLELPLGRHFSIGGDWYSPWLWPKADNRNCFEFQMADAYLRWWINPRHIDGFRGNTFTGHSLALEAFGGHFDFEKDFRGIQGEIYGASLEYNYAFLLCRHLRLEIGAAFGYAQIPWRDYTVYSEGGKLIRNNTAYDYVKNWYGPTKLQVSLTVPLSTETKEKGRRRHEK